MARLCDYFGSGPPKQRNLQDGLFQIASQTCNLLVQVNNTNNISFGGNSTNICLNNLASSTTTSNASNGKSHDDQEQLLVLIPPSTKIKSKPGILGKPRLSTVLEGAPPVNHEEDGDLWGAGSGYMLPSDHNGSPSRRWGNRKNLCRPSCIPISIICVLIFLVVLLPLLDHVTEKALQQINTLSPGLCSNSCSISLVESLPEGLSYPNTTIVNPSTFDTWLDLINNAENTIEIASFYWTLRQSEVYPDPSSIQGETIFQAILKAGTDRGITVKIAQNAPTQNNPNIDTEYLVKRKAAEVRSLNFVKLLGNGVLHTKLWIVDGKHIYLGSANMDWRSLTQVKELGVLISNCTCLANDAQKLFEVYWSLGEEGSKIPDQWPKNLSTHFNVDTPMNLTSNNETFQIYLSNSPPPFNPTGRTNDVDALLNVINHAEKFIYIAVMDYFPLMIYSPKLQFWPVIDDALKTAAIDNQVKVKMLISKWNHSRESEDNFLKSLASINKSYTRVSFEIKRFVVPANKEQAKIPFARVNHNKYMVTDNSAFIGTSNWSGDYFTNTAGTSFIFHDPIYNRDPNVSTVRSDLQAVFERDWNSEYAISFNI